MSAKSVGRRPRGGAGAEGEEEGAEKQPSYNKRAVLIAVVAGGFVTIALIAVMVIAGQGRDRKPPAAKQPPDEAAPKEVQAPEAPPAAPKDGKDKPPAAKTPDAKTAKQPAAKTPGQSDLEPPDPGGPFKWSDGQWYSIKEPDYVKFASPEGKAAQYASYSRYRVDPPK
jgi:hypothetical protein